MKDLTSLEGKIIDSFEEKNDGKNSFLIMKFKQGGKANIISYLRGNEGVAQLDIELNGLQPKDLIGKKIVKTNQEFDGDRDMLILYLKGGKEIIFSAYASSPESTASIDISFYSGDKIVAESLEENMYQKWGEYPMCKPQYENSTLPMIVIKLLKKSSASKDIKRILSDYYESVKEDDNTITIIDPTASIEDVSDLIYKYIQDGTVYSVDQL